MYKEFVKYAATYILEKFPFITLVMIQLTPQRDHPINVAVSSRWSLKRGKIKIYEDNAMLGPLFS